MKNNTIEVTLNSYGTLGVVSIPVKLYKDSYKVVKLRVNAPVEDNAVLKVYSTDKDEAGETVWTSHTYALPYKQKVSINGIAYDSYESYLPQEFCEDNGNLNITFALAVVSDGGVVRQEVDDSGRIVSTNADKIITSGTLNIYVGGEGFNFAGVRISDSDILASNVNQVIRDVEDLDNRVTQNTQDIADIKSDYVKHEELSDVEQRVESIESNYVTLDTKQTITSEKDFKSGNGTLSVSQSNIVIQNQNSSENNRSIIDVKEDKILLGSTDEDGNGFVGLTHNSRTKYNFVSTTDITGKLTYNGKEVATQDQIGEVNADTLIGLIGDSNSIVASSDGEKVTFEIDANLTNKISKSLVTPMSTPTKTELVAVDNTNSQRMIEIGDGLSLENGVLSATEDVDTSNLVDLSSSQTITGFKAFEGGIRVTRDSTTETTELTTTSQKLRSQSIYKSGTRRTILENGINGAVIGSDNQYNGLDFKGIEVKPTGNVNITGTLNYNGKEVATTDQIGTGGSSVTVVDTLISQSTTDALSARQGNVLYTMLTEAGTEINQNELNAQKHILIGGDGVLQGNVYNFTIQNADSYIAYRTNLTKFLVDLNLAIVGDLDKTKEVAITFGDTTYYLFNILKGTEHATIGDLQQVERYNNATGYRFITEMTFFQTSDLVGFAVIPTISVSDILSLDSDQMDDYMADGGLSQGQLAVCNKVINNGYDEGAIYRFDITYPNTYSWTQLGYSKSGIDNAIRTAIQDTWEASY